MARAQRRSEDEASARRCVVTRQSAAPDAMLRFVLGPDGVLTPDIRRKLPGRGAWTLLSRAVVVDAIRRKAFQRALKVPVAVPDDLAGLVERLLAHDALQTLSLCNKAGLVTTGFAKVEAAVGGQGLAALIAASDAAEDGRRKLMQTLRRRHGDAANAVPVIDCFASDDLALALGRDLVIHAALMNGAAAGSFLDRWRRLVHFRTRPLDPADTGTEALTAGASELDDVTAGQTS
jgi:predicted RNA-binding protein YlxR (DUF448 family)